MGSTLEQAMADFSPSLPLAVAYSGGADSTALLVACAERWPSQVVAIHVHHGLQAAADAFEQHCRSTCERWQLPLHVVRVDARAADGQSPEEAAREARYAALAQCARTQQPAIHDIALAQQADDQVETLLIALGRGAGLPGLSAMPAQVLRDGLCYHRPLLAVPGKALRDGLRARGIAWIEDPSNADERYTRNRIRARMMPALEATFPHFRETFARSAAHAAQAGELLDELAAADLLAVGVPPRIRSLRELSSARQANVLRYWLRSAHQTAPSAAQLKELQAQLVACTTRGHRIHLRVGAGHVQRRGDVLAWYNC